MQQQTPQPQLVLVTGATGYVGGRLVRALEERNAAVRCLARRPEFLRPRVAPTTEVMGGDITDAGALRDVLRGVHTAYYLVHSMASGDDFEREDRDTAQGFAAAALSAGVQRIVYLGALGHGTGLSTHLESRQEVGRILRQSGVPTIEFRASVIIGSGSLSFEMVRALVDKLPVMTTPRWVRTPAQPIAVEDVIAYLVEALDRPPGPSEIFEIGGRDAVAYGDLMTEYARQRGLRRWIIPVPVLTPGLSSRWLRLITPLYARVGKALIEGVRNPTVVLDDRARREFRVQPRGMREAIARALVNEDQEFAATRWSDARSSIPTRPGYGGMKLGSRLVDSRSLRVPCAAAYTFTAVRRIGGPTGWYCANLLWRLRGAIDLLVGGVGLRRGRRDPEHLTPGDTLDFWRVEAYEPGRLLRLAAEMRLPGRAWLQFEVDADGATNSTLRQTALFDPRGLGGLLYWYALWPIHQYVFGGMIRAIAGAALRDARLRSPAV